MIARTPVFPVVPIFPKLGKNNDKSKNNKY